MTPKLARWLLPVLAAVCCLAQSTSATVSGKIADPSGSMTQSADVTALNEDTGLRRSTASNEEGSYVLP
jgi:hypothetical protein